MTRCSLKVKVCNFAWTGIGVRDQFRLGGLSSVARIFSPLLARKSSGFARILPDFLPEYGYLKNSRGGGGCQSPPPPPRTPIREWFTVHRVIELKGMFVYLS